GGEPLLARCRDTIAHIIKRAKAEGDNSFWAVTNATELDAYADLLGPEGISVLQITLDGPEAEHDRRRIYPDGTGSFARIARNLHLALERGAQVQVRVNVDRGNLADLPAVARTILREGWDESPAFSAYAAVIHPSSTAIEPTTTLSTWDLRKELERMRAEDADMRVFTLPDARMQQNLHNILLNRLNPAPFMKSAFCSAHDKMYIFDAFADIYACWERTGDAKIRIGSISPEGAITSNGPMLKQWRTRSAASNPVCARCRYVLHCGGGCAVLAEAKHGRFFGNHCDAFGQRFRASAAGAYTALLSGQDLTQARAAVCDQ
ncbi:radical SAM protein, partial [Methylobacterium soli]